MVTSGAGVENVNKAIQLLTDTKPVRALMAQGSRSPTGMDARAQGIGAQGGRKGPVEEMGLAELRQELAKSHNTICQLRKNQEPFKRQRRDGWQRNGRWQDQQAPEQQGPKKGVNVPEGAGKAVKTQQSQPKKADVNMLWACRETSDLDEEQNRERVCFVRARIDEPAEPISSEQIK